MTRLLSLDPMQRSKCSEALKMDYFGNKPAPTPGPLLPMPSSLTQDSTEAELVPGSKRKLREGLETSGLAKKLVF